MGSENKQYAERDAYELDKSGGYYVRHVMAMTSEKLHAKSDIAAELGHRDMVIDQLRAEVEALRAVAGMGHLLPELDDALEALELFGLHSDEGYRKLKDWYRKMLQAAKAIDAAMAAGEGRP